MALEGSLGVPNNTPNLGKMDYYEKMYRALLKTIVSDGTKHLIGRSYRDTSGHAIERNRAIGEIAAEVYRNGTEISSEDYRKLCEDLRKV